MSAPERGHYPIERRAGEIERLYIQGDAMAPDTEIMLDKIGVAQGWHCLDIGCGPRGITDLLAKRVGSDGRVVGLDADPVFIEAARAAAAANTEIVEGNAYESQLPAATFDLVHMRFVASTAGAPDRLLAEARRLAKPGGIVVLQEPDMAALNCYPPHPAWDRLKSALQGAFSSVGADICLAQSLFAVARRAGLSDVQYRTFVVGVRSTDPMNDYLPSTAESLRGTIVGNGLMEEADFDRDLADCRAHIRDPDTVFTMYIVAQVWGRNPL